MQHPGYFPPRRPAKPSMLSSLRAIFRRQPALVIGSLVSIGLQLQTVLVDGDVTNWRNAIPVLAAWLIKQNVFSPATAEKIANSVRISPEQFDQLQAALVARPPRDETSRDGDIP